MLSLFFPELRYVYRQLLVPHHFHVTAGRLIRNLAKPPFQSAEIGKMSLTIWKVYPEASQQGAHANLQLIEDSLSLKWLTLR